MLEMCPRRSDSKIFGHGSGQVAWTAGYNTKGWIFAVVWHWEDWC